MNNKKITINIFSFYFSLGLNTNSNADKMLLEFETVKFELKKPTAVYAVSIIKRNWQFLDAYLTVWIWYSGKRNKRETHKSNKSIKEKILHVYLDTG